MEQQVPAEKQDAAKASSREDGKRKTNTKTKAMNIQDVGVLEKIAHTLCLRNMKGTKVMPP